MSKPVARSAVNVVRIRSGQPSSHRCIQRGRGTARAEIRITGIRTSLAYLRKGIPDRRLTYTNLKR